ncbi:MAG TPA: hypothetical protein VFE61_26205 [Candidatus Sulfotelmatobacter sp.]|nr:hypothetical protein [Candidatus Sulfotelmatobacter sp.]
MAQKLLAINLFEVAKVLLYSEIEEEAKAVVVRLQCLFAFGWLIFALEELRFGDH